MRYGSLKGYWRLRPGSLEARIYIGPDFCFYAFLMTLVVVSSIVTALFSCNVQPLFFWLSLGVLIVTTTFYSLVALGDPGIPKPFFSP